MRVKKWMAQLQINKPNNRKCNKLSYLRDLPQLPRRCNLPQVLLLLQRRLNLKQIGHKCWSNRSETWTQSDNGKWKKKKLESYNWLTSNKKQKKPLKLLLQPLKPQRKNKWNNKNNKKLLHSIKIPKDARNPRATNWIRHLWNEEGRTMTTSIYPLTAQVWIEQNPSQPWLLPQ